MNSDEAGQYLAIANDKGVVKVYLLDKIYLNHDNREYCSFSDHKDVINQIILREFYDQDTQMITIGQDGIINTYSMDFKERLFTYTFEQKHLT